MIVFFILVGLINTQTITICDSQSGLPLADVNVFKNNVGTTTDSNGVCDLHLFQADDQVTFSSIGYITVKQTKNEVPKVFFMKNELISMDPIYIVGNRKRLRKNYSRLEKDVKRVYPYAKRASELLAEYKPVIDSLYLHSGFTRYQRKREVFSKIEEELISRYGYQIRRLTRNQGRILIKLIDRETNKTSYNIIKDFRNVFSAGFWQLTARMFGHNLKSGYRPQKGEDRLIEIIVSKIETRKSLIQDKARN